jgi:hypothetical protein
VRNPDCWLDNISGSLDALELELKSLTDSNTVICLHNNQLLLDGSSETAQRFRSIIKDHKIVLAISVPPSIIEEEQGAEYLASHVHYGSSNGALLFGLLGPLIIDASVTLSRVRMYTTAQAKCGNLTLVVDVHDFGKLESLLRDTQLSINHSRTVYVGLTKENVDAILKLVPHVNVGLNFSPDSISRDSSALSPEKCIQIRAALGTDSRVTFAFSTGCKYKTDLLKYGGQGFEFAFNFLRQSSPNAAKTNATFSSLLEFAWNPPKLCVMRDVESQKWVCDVCGFIARSDEAQNYTKHGFTYCSVACLSVHRKRNFNQ